MKKLFTLIILLTIFLSSRAQTKPFGEVDMADLKLTSCDFEKGAAAMVLFDKSEITTGFTSTTVLRHKRIKILTGAGKDVATVKLDYVSAEGSENISNIQAETINLENGKIDYAVVDEKLIYHEKVDRSVKRVSFTFPKVKEGSIIEYSYKLTLGSDGDFPDWDFQGDLPVRYCELRASIRDDYGYKMTPRIYQPYELNTSEYWIKSGDTIGKKYAWALKNINSFSEEPFSTCPEDDIQKVAFRLTAYKATAKGALRPLEKSWYQVGSSLLYYDDVGKQMDLHVNDAGLVKQAKELHTNEEIISFLFSQVKSQMKWNNRTRFYTIDGIKKAWDKKIGNSAEINFILYDLLTRAGIACYPDVVSTREHGRVDTQYPTMYQFNNLVLFVPLVNHKYYVLDASNKYNNYQDIPYDILNSTGLILKKDSDLVRLSYLANQQPSRKNILVNAEITPDAKMTGTAQINNFSYHRSDVMESYKSDGEEKYKNKLRDNDNNLKISSVKFDNMEIDSLPLTQNIDFKLDLTGSDDNYIYFNPNQFTGLNNNPFVKEERNSDINFKFLRYYNINGRYKIPEKYKIESLPKSMNLLMPDTSITFKRVVAEEEGCIIVHYVINFKKSYFPKDDYQAIRTFYRKMHELLNEQIVLKKA